MAGRACTKEAECHWAAGQARCLVEVIKRCRRSLLALNGGFGCLLLLVLLVLLVLWCKRPRRLACALQGDRLQTPEVQPVLSQGASLVKAKEFQLSRDLANVEDCQGWVKQQHV